MLTEQGYRERRWGPFPALRKAIEDKFDALVRLVEIALLAHEYETIVRETAHSVGLKPMSRDLLKLEEKLEDARSFFELQAKHIRTLHSTL